MFHRSVWSFAQQRTVDNGPTPTTSVYTAPVDIQSSNTYTVPRTFAPGAYKLSTARVTEGYDTMAYDVYFAVKACA